MLNTTATCLFIFWIIRLRDVGHKFVFFDYKCPVSHSYMYVYYYNNMEFRLKINEIFLCTKARKLYKCFTYVQSFQRNFLNKDGRTKKTFNRITILDVNFEQSLDASCERFFSPSQQQQKMFLSLLLMTHREKYFVYFRSNAASRRHEPHLVLSAFLFIVGQKNIINLEKKMLFMSQHCS